MATDPATSRKRERLALGEAAILSLQHAIELLPLRDGEARGWLEEKGLIRLLRGRPVVCWGEVLIALRAHEATREPERSPSPQPPLPRVHLDPL